MALPAPETETELVSVEEYLRREETAEEKHEFHAVMANPMGDIGDIVASGQALGEIFAMSGGTYNHARVATNLTIALGVRLRNSPCQVLDSNMRVAVKPTGRFVYPEASIVCATPAFLPTDGKHTTLLNPRVIFEVLSDSTEKYDRGEKFNHYRRIEALEEYVLIAQDRPLVEGFWRQGDGTWSMATWEGLDATAKVRCVSLDLPLAELYAGLSFTDDKASSASPL